MCEDLTFQKGLRTLDGELVYELHLLQEIFVQVLLKFRRKRIRFSSTKLKGVGGIRLGECPSGVANFISIAQ